MLFNGELARLDREVPEVGKALRATVAERLDSDQGEAPRGDARRRRRVARFRVQIPGAWARR